MNCTYAIYKLHLLLLDTPGQLPSRSLSFKFINPIVVNFSQCILFFICLIILLDIMLWLSGYWIRCWTHVHKVWFRVINGMDELGRSCQGRYCVNSAERYFHPSNLTADNSKSPFALHLARHSGIHCTRQWHCFLWNHGGNTSKTWRAEPHEAGLDE